MEHVLRVKMYTLNIGWTKMGEAPDMRKARKGRVPKTFAITCRTPFPITSQPLTANKIAIFIVTLNTQYKTQTVKLQNVGRAVLSRSFDLLNSMILWSRWFVEQDPVSNYAILVWQIFPSILVWSVLEKGITYGCDHYRAVNSHFPVY